MTRYPLQTLAARLGITLGQIGGQGADADRDERPQGLAALAEAVGHTGTRWALRQLAEHGLDPWEADRYAVAAGWLPGDVWPDWDPLTDDADPWTLDLADEGYSDDPDVDTLDPIDAARLAALRADYAARQAAPPPADESRPAA